MIPERLDKIQRLADKDGRFRREAYVFVLNALTYTQNMHAQKGRPGHITGQELCEGIRAYAESEFGFLAKTVFSQWGVTRTEDFGTIVFSLVGAEELAKTEEDSIRDFENVYAFDDVFEKSIL